MRIYLLKSIRFLLQTLIILLISGCGFHLRGNVPLPPQLRQLYIETKTPYDLLIAELKRNLQDINVIIVDHPKHTIILHIIKQNITQQLGNISASTNTRQFTIHYSVTFELLGTQQQPIIAANTITAVKNLTLNSNQILGSTSEEQTLLQEMRQTLVQMIIYKLQAQNTLRHL